VSDLWPSSSPAPDEPDDGFRELGTFDPPDAKQVLRLLEENDIPFEIEADHSALMQPGRFLAQQWGMNPAGSRMKVFVPETHLDIALRRLESLYPPERAPASSPLGPAGPAPESDPALEVYTPPATDVRRVERREFYTEPGEESHGQPPEKDG
jgi:hypothetical protein